ncbi:MAG: sigma-70 family RNA polymerase sigma factor, partial [Nocardioidaceae bacterium]
IALERGGDAHAYGTLFDRHRESANRLARQLVSSADADDLVSEAFIKVLRVLKDGGGPDIAFRPYLLTAVRRLHVDRIRSNSKVTPSDEMDRFDPGVPFADPAVANFESSAAAKAFASLPERWQMVLWHLEVEGQKPADIAPLLGMSANSVSALAYRAREGLRQAYLQMHLADTAAEECRWTTERLGSHVRGGLSKRDAAKVDQHLDECPRCAAVYLELAEVNSNLRGIIAPLLLGAAAAGYLSTSGGLAGAGLLGGWLLRAKEAVASNAGVTGAVAASTVVVVGVVTAMIVQGPDDRETVSGILPTQPAVTSGGPSSSGPGDDPVPTRSLEPTRSVESTRSLLPTRSLSPAAPPGAPSSAPSVSGGGLTPSLTQRTSGSTSTSSTTTGSEPSRTTSSSEPSRTTSSTSPSGSTGTSPTSSSTSEPPRTTTGSTPPTTSVPPVVEPDLTLALSSELISRDKRTYRSTVNLGGVPNDVTPTVTVAVSRFNNLAFSADWSCTPPVDRKRRTYTCSPDAGAGQLVITVRFHPRGAKNLTADVSAPGVDDPDLSNNSDSLQA